MQYQSFDDAVDLVRMPSAVSGFSFGFAGYALGTFGGISFSFYFYSFADALAWDLVVVVLFFVRDSSRSTLLRYFYVALPCRANFVALTCWVFCVFPLPMTKIRRTESNPGRLFVRRLIDLTKSATRLNYHMSITSEAREDIL